MLVISILFCFPSDRFNSKNRKIPPPQGDRGRIHFAVPPLIRRPLAKTASFLRCNGRSRARLLVRSAFRRSGAGSEGVFAAGLPPPSTMPGVLFAERSSVTGPLHRCSGQYFSRRIPDCQPLDGAVFAPCCKNTAVPCFRSYQNPYSCAFFYSCRSHCHCFVAFCNIQLGCPGQPLHIE